MMRRLFLTHCPTFCAQFMVTAEGRDPGLWLLAHIDRAHPELVYGARELERRRLAALYARRTN